MKKYILATAISLVLLAQAVLIFADTFENNHLLGSTSGTTFSVTQPAVIQNMVPNSTQNLSYVLSSNGGVVTVHCAFTSDNPDLTASFNNSGCITAIGVQPGVSPTVNVTLSLADGASGSMTGTITFTQTNGRQGTNPNQSFSVPITVPATTNRTITFKNYCPFAVAFGISSSAIPAKNNNTIACSTDSDCSAYTYSTCVGGYCGGGACQSDSDCVNSNPGTCTVPTGSQTASCSYCASDSDCMTGASCDTTNHQCFWTLPVPSDAATNHYILNAYSGSGEASSDTITIPDNSSVNGYSLMWGGGFAGRTNCSFNSGTNELDCDTATCNDNGSGDGQGGCNLGEGFSAPSTLAEVTFVATTPDTYDISIINGVNIPVSMHPSSGSASTASQYGNPYDCGAAGSDSSSVTSGGTLGACSWDFSPPAVSFRWVDTDNGTSCTVDSTCISINSKYRCGLTSALVNSGSNATVCGTPLGYWNQNEICATNSSYNQSGIVNCTLTNINSTGNSILNLLGCTGGAAVSCYNVSATNSTCCGCTNWQNQGITVPTDSSVVAQCQYNNSSWGAGSYPSATGSVLPGLIWLKSACPSAYTYPFDDKSSTFTCPQNNGQSAVNYTVEFCPGQETAGIPAS